MLMLLLIHAGANFIMWSNKTFIFELAALYKNSMGLDDTKYVKGTGMTEQEIFIQDGIWNKWFHKFYYVFLTLSSVGYGDGLSMPLGLTNP